MKSTGFILNGIYYEELPPNMRDVQNVMYKQHDHDRQREEHRRDLIQPWTRDGKPNAEFIAEYPEEAKQYGFIPKD